MENLESNKHLLYAVRIILERKEIDNIWESHKWVVNDLIPLNVSNGSGYPPINDVRIHPLINDIQIEGSNSKIYMWQKRLSICIALRLRVMPKTFNHQTLLFI